MPSAKTKKRARNSAQAKTGTITKKQITQLRRQFTSNSSYRIAQNAVTKVPLNNVALDRSIVTRMDHTFSNTLDDWKATNQKKSGRCWIFAGTNLFKAGAIKKMKLKDFEFSQNYVLFWDKFEKANYFLEAIIETADSPVDDRTVAFLLSHPLDDGGQWNMFANVINKHGLVPKSAMPETESSSNTGRMNSNVIAKLREGAKTLRELKAKGATIRDLRQVKGELLDVVYRILSIHLGTPPEKFDWQWYDKDRKFHRDGTMTPQTFAKKYITIPLDDYVCLVHDPRKSNPTRKTYTVKYLGNVIGGDIVFYLNVDVKAMKKIAMKTIQDGEPVWFGCDTGPMMERKNGLWDVKLFDYEGVYDTEFNLDKAGRLLYHQTAMNHAMLFTGVDIVKDKPRRWRVENSWGDESGEKGFFIMNDNWFDEHMFEIAARKKYLPPKLKEALKLKPIVLPPWDPMGSLAS